ncbi:MAG: tetratricopeptide repeat protein [Acidimicrobiales bacterium]
MNERPKRRNQMANPGGRKGTGGPKPGSRPSGKSGPSRNGRRIPPPPKDSPRGPSFDSRGFESDRDGYDDEPIVERVEERKRSKKSTHKKRGVDVRDVEMRGVTGPTAAKLQRRLAEAAVAFEAERFTEADQALKSIQKLAPGIPEVHELMGLTHYRMGRWIKAINELERFYELTDSVEQHPVWADCCRALKRWSKAEELWHELGDASPGPELIEEGRIVQAGALADRGQLDDAIRFMERAPKVKGKPGLHHLRRWYVMGDLYERAGDNSRARRVFSDIAQAEPGFGDAAERAANL